MKKHTITISEFNDYTANERLACVSGVKNLNMITTINNDKTVIKYELTIMKNPGASWEQSSTIFDNLSEAIENYNKF